MAEPIVTLRIKDFLLDGQIREVKIYRGQLLLTAINPGKELSSAKIGVVESAGVPLEAYKKFGSYVTLSPYYEFRKDSKTGLIVAKRISKYHSSLYAHAFNNVSNGNAKHIAEALKHPPFQGLELVADRIKDLDVPYSTRLEQLFEKPAEEMIEAVV